MFMRDLRPVHTLKTRNVLKQSESCVRHQIKVVVIVSHRRTHAVVVVTPSRAQQPIGCRERERVTGLVPKCFGSSIL